MKPKNWNNEQVLEETRLQKQVRDAIHQENEDNMATEMIRQMVRFTIGGTR